MRTIDHTHDAAATSWLASANGAATDFPIQNLPFAVFRRAGALEPLRGGVAIGDEVMDLAALSRTQCLDGLALQAAQSCAAPALNDFFALGPVAWRTLRRALFELLHKDAVATIDFNLAVLPAEHLVFGHDPGVLRFPGDPQGAREPGTMAMRYDGRLFPVDVGMSYAVGFSSGAMLRITRNPDKATAFYPDGTARDLWP